MTVFSGMCRLSPGLGPNGTKVFDYDQDHSDA